MFLNLCYVYLITHGYTKVYIWFYKPLCNVNQFWFAGLFLSSSKQQLRKNNLWAQYLQTVIMGSKTSKNLFSNHQREINNSPNRFLCDNSKKECEKSVRIQSSGNKSSRNTNKFCRISTSKTSHDDSHAEDVESGELLGEGTNKTLFPQRHNLQAVSSGEWVNCVPLYTLKQNWWFLFSYICGLSCTMLWKGNYIPQWNTTTRCNLYSFRESKYVRKYS